MSRFTDDDLILYYYGEVASAEEIERELERSTDLRDRFAALRQLLDAIEESPIPDRSTAYGSRVWHRLAAELEPRGGLRFPAWFRPSRQWAWTAAVLVLLVAAYVTGRLMPRAGAPEIAGLSEAGRERILMMTVAGHLERSEMLLLELVNTRGNGGIDLTLERQLADELGQESRLYRQAARQAGKADIAAVLDQLETVMLEISNAPQQVESADLGELRVRLDEGDVLFRVRVLGSRLRREALVDERSEDRGPEARDI